MADSEKWRITRRGVLGGLAAGALIGWRRPVAGAAADPASDGLEGWDARRFGARGDGQTKDTQAIQRAIDACAEAGGGSVLLRGGAFLSGTLFLRSDVRLWIDAGSVLLGSRDIEDYPSVTPQIVFLYRSRFTRSLIYAEQAENVSLAGRGLIDGQGEHFPARRGDDALRPYLIRFSQCRNVSVRDLTMHNSARWLSHYLACQNVTIDGLTIRAPIRENRDGIDIDSCDRVRISNCDLCTGDDAIVLKATTAEPCRQVAVTNCTLSSMASALKLGTESNGGFEDILFSNCTIYDTVGSGINLGMVDGGVCQRVSISNISMRDVQVPIFIRLGNRARQIPELLPPGMGRMRDVMISNVQAAGAGELGCSITGLPEFPVEDVTLQNVRLRFSGGGLAEDVSREISELPAAYPSQRMFGKLPAYGFYCRHVRNLRMQQVDVALAGADARPGFVCEDVRRAVLADCAADSSDATPWLVWARQCQELSLTGWRPRPAAARLLRVDGEDTRDIVLLGNDCSRLEAIVERGSGVPANQITCLSNHPPATQGPMTGSPF